MTRMVVLADVIRLDIRKKFFRMRVNASKTLAQVVQRGDRCPIPGNIQGLDGALSNLI